MMPPELTELKKAAIAPRKVSVIYETLADAVWDRVAEMPNGCWEWQGHRDDWGYGRFGFRGKGRIAHRVAWELVNGEIATREIQVCHSCDNPPCCNPSHLWLGTMQENQADKMRKGRGKPPDIRGEQCHMAKLTEDDVRAIRAAYTPGKISQQELADRYGVTDGTISYILQRKTWAHVG